jgi:hypothetical protein
MMPDLASDVGETAGFAARVKQPRDYDDLPAFRLKAYAFASGEINIL